MFKIEVLKSKKPFESSHREGRSTVIVEQHKEEEGWEFRGRVQGLASS